MNEFKKLNMSDNLFEVIQEMGFTKPTKIQSQSIPLILNGKDVIGESATGSGKTLAFGCGVVESVEPKEGLQALILTPTRELAEQVKESIKVLSAKKKLRVISIYGGVSINPQIKMLPRSEVVIATPGRLKDHMQRGTINLSKIKLLILDEADRMLDMGFIEDVEEIIKRCPKERQTLFFSATMATKIKELAHRYMANPEKVSAGRQVDPSKLKQVYFDVSKNKKMSLLVHLLKKEEAGLVMVFCNTRRTVDFVTKSLKANKINAIAIHGGLSQNKRTKTLGLFNDAKVSVLICTDVAARGLHIGNVSHIYNYEIPNDPTDYVHRIGRTARAGKEGKVINVLCERDHANFGRVMDLNRAFQVDRQETPEVERVIIAKAERSFNGRDSRNGRRGSGRSNGRRSNSSSRRNMDSRNRFW